MMKLSFGDIPKRNESTKISIRRPLWYKADEDDIYNFTLDVHDKLANLVLPNSLSCSNPQCKISSHSIERDNLLTDMVSSIIESSHECIPMPNKRNTKRTINCPIEKSIPRWKEIVEPYRVDAKFWNSVWYSAQVDQKMGFFLIS